MSNNTFSVVLDEKANDFLQKTVKDLMDTTAQQYVAELQEKLQPQIVIFDEKKFEIDRSKHYMLKNVVYKCIVHKQLYMAGPAGSGKTTLAKDLAESMGVPFYFISCTAGMSEAHLLGRMLFDGTYVPSDFVRAYEEGGVFLFDEIDAADNNTLLVINSALANGKLSIPNRKEKAHAERHNNFICICAGNSWGNGTIQYQGRTALDRAFLDRFAMSKLFIDYDADMEKLLSKSFPEVAKSFQEFRGFLASKMIDKVVSTRTVVSAVKDRANGHKIQSIMRAFITDWSKDEIIKAEEFISKLQ